MISSGLECISSWRAKRRSVKIIVGDTLSGKCIKSRRLNWATKGARTTEAYIGESSEIRQNKTAVSYYTDQILQVQADLDSLLTARAAIMAEAGYGGIDYPRIHLLHLLVGEAEFFHGAGSVILQDNI